MPLLSEVLLCARVPHRGAGKPTRRHLEVGDRRLRPVPLILELLGLQLFQILCAPLLALGARTQRTRPASISLLAECRNLIRFGHVQYLPSLVDIFLSAVSKH